MTGWLAGLVAGWAVCSFAGAQHRWPWRVGELVPSARAPQSRPAPTRRRLRSVRRPLRRPAGPPQDLVVVIDLLHVAVSAGHTLHTAVVVVGQMGSGPVAAALERVDRSFGRGRSTIDALGELPDELGPTVRPLVTTLLSSMHSGAPLAPALQRLADAERGRERRRAEERVRRLPVLLLAPLIGLVLPAFVVLAIVPVAWTTARAGLLLASA